VKYRGWKDFVNKNQSKVSKRRTSKSSETEKKDEDD